MSEHKIAIEPFNGWIRVSFEGTIVADTDKALVLREADYPAIFYLPKGDLNAGSVAPSDHKSHCPFKGDASYFHLIAGDRRADNAIWYYADPIEAVAAIRDHVAFYPSKAKIEVFPG